MPNANENYAKTKDSLSAHVREAAEETKDDLTDIAHQAGRTLRQCLTGGRREVAEITESCTAAIRAKPVQSSLVALGVGYLLASLLMRR